MENVGDIVVDDGLIMVFIVVFMMIDHGFILA